jgi:hypothetical protein
MTDSLSGHTAAQNTLGADGLRDGDALSTATLTNALQGLHGNGILRLQDGAYGSTRNATNSQPGAMVRASAHTLTVTGGYVALDGALYEFASGPGGSATLVLGDGTDGNGGIQLASASEEALYVVYVASAGGEAKVHYEGGSPVNTTNGLYPVAPSAYLTDYNTGVAQSNMKTIVLAVVRVKGGGSGNHSVDIQEINDKRVFLPPSVRYMAPLSLGDVVSNKVNDGGGEGVNTVTHLNALQTDAGELAVGDSITALWPSHPRYGALADFQTAATAGQPGYGHGPSRGKDIADKHVKNALYFAGRNNEGTGHYSVRLDGRGVDASPTVMADNRTITLTADGDSFLMLKVADAKTLTINPETDGTNYKFPEGHMVEICNESAGTGLIVFDQPELNSQLDPSHRATFIYEGSKWIRCDYQQPTTLNTPAIYDNSGTPAFRTGITQGEVLALLGVEAGATADQSNAEIRAAVEAASDSNVFTDADHSKLNAIEASADVTDATNVNAAGAIMHTDVSTKGDLIVGDGAGDATILGVGTNNHVLTADSGEASGVKWAAASGGGGITALTGNVTASGSGSVAATIADEAVTYAKMQHVSATSKVLGRITSGAGDVEELSAANLRAILTVADGSLSENNFTNADHSKLNGIETAADVTDATNVAAAGAVMVGGIIPYAPANPALWVGAPPASITIAIQRIAAALAPLLVGSGAQIP